MEFKTFEFKLSSTMDSGIVEGYASTFGNIDLGQDIVEPGAFKRTIKSNKGIVPILADHDPSKQIGWNISAEEDSKGLYVKGQLNMDTQLGKERYALAKQAMALGAPMGMSIGYGVIKQDPDKTNPAVRRLKELKLYEYSLVTFPMNTMAMVTAAKNWSLDMDPAQIAMQLKAMAEEKGINLNAVVEALRKELAPTVDSSLAGHSIDALIRKIKEAT